MNNIINWKYISDCIVEDDMRRTVISFLSMLLLMGKMPAINAQRSIPQYFHLTGLPYSTSLPVTTYSAATNNLVTSSSPTTNQARPTSGLPSLAAISLPSLIVPASQPQTELPYEIPSPKDSNIDGKLLNNLAIALQMLILSNILNSSPTDTASEKCKSITAESSQSQLQHQNNFDPSQPIYSQPQSSYSPPQITYSPQLSYSAQPSYSPQPSHSPQPSYSPPQTSYSPVQTSNIPPQYSYSQTQNSYSPTQNMYSPTQNMYSPTQNQNYASHPEQLLPSANLIGVPSFAEPKLEKTVKRTRNNFNLMSPYEALAQPYSDSSSSYMPSISRRDFQSPYAMIDTNMDFFPMNDLF